MLSATNLTGATCKCPVELLAMRGNKHLSFCPQAEKVTPDFKAIERPASPRLSLRLEVAQLQPGDYEPDAATCAHCGLPIYDPADTGLWRHEIDKHVQCVTGKNECAEPVCHPASCCCDMAAATVGQSHSASCVHNPSNTGKRWCTRCGGSRNDDGVCSYVRCPDPTFDNRNEGTTPRTDTRHDVLNACVTVDERLNTDRSVGDAAEGERRRDDGIAKAQAVAGRKQLINECRAALVRTALSRKSRTVTSDDAHFWLTTQAHPDAVLGNAMGVMFRALPDWKFAGVQKSTRKEAHARNVSVWQYTGGAQCQ